jgi:hypothetical protein
MNWYSVENTSKWGISEIQFLVNHDLGIGIRLDTNWKWGTFDIESETKLDTKKLEDKYQEELDLYCEFDNVQVNFLDSGTEEITFWDVDFKDEIDFDDGDRIIEEWQNEGWNAFDDNGFNEELDPEMWIADGISIKESDNPYEL